MKPCKVCLIQFEPTQGMRQTCCSPECGYKFARDKRIAKENKAYRKETRVRREAAKTETQYLNDLQKIVNRYCRLRDMKLGCVSCDKPYTWHGQWHASHFWPRSTSSAVRFNLWGLNKSCSTCNAIKSGNLTEYRPRLIAKIGQAKFDWLEEHHNDIAEWDIDWIKRAIEVARKGVKRMEKRYNQA